MESPIGVVMCTVSFIVGFGHKKSASAEAQLGGRCAGAASVRRVDRADVFSVQAYLGIVNYTNASPFHYSIVQFFPYIFLVLNQSMS